jgi:uncharacterized protein DUF397
MTTEITSWRKSSFSGSQGGNCVEVAGHDGRILVRDTKDRGQVQRFTPASWRAFVAAVRSRESGLGESAPLP